MSLRAQTLRPPPCLFPFSIYNLSCWLLASGFLPRALKSLQFCLLFFDARQHLFFFDLRVARARASRHRAERRERRERRVERATSHKGTCVSYMHPRQTARIPTHTTMPIYPNSQFISFLIPALLSPLHQELWGWDFFQFLSNPYFYLPPSDDFPNLDQILDSYFRCDATTSSAHP